MVRSCEKYLINEDKWVALPDLNEFKFSTSICLLDNRFLYAFGGIGRME